MTVRFIKSWNGYYEGQIVTSPNGGQSEATLIALGYAVADLDGPDNSPVPVFAQTNPLTGVIKTTAGVVPIGFSKKRSMYPVNLMDPRLTGGYVTTLGTASEVAATSETGHSVVTCTATTAGSTARILKGFTALTLDTTKYYELSCTVVSATFGNRGAMAQPWFGLSGGAPAEGVQALSIGASAPVAGQRYSMRFRPAVASNIIRVGMGINTAENVLVGDSLVTTDFSLYEIPALASVVEDYSYNAFGIVGKNQTYIPAPGSCVWAIGDSWTNDLTDWAAVLGTTYGREVRVTATAGDTLAVMKARVDTAAALGANWLLNPAQNVPGVAVIIGGINDLVADASITTLTSRAQTLIDYVRARSMIPIFVLQPFASDSNYYTAGRMAIRTAFATYIKQEGCDYFDLADEGYLTAGAANATNMISESLNWTHPSAAGITLLTTLLEKRLREIDRACVVLNSPTWP